MRRRYAGLITIGGALVAYVLLARSRQLRWGATDQEADGPLPGDDLIVNPGLSATRAITVGASADRVWPWIAQLGQGRGGFYSYDFLENLVGCDIHSADRIVPEWQDVAVGDEVSSIRRWGWRWPPWSQGDRWFSTAPFPWGIPPRPTTPPGPSSFGSSQTGPPGCWPVSDTRTPGGGLPSSSSRSQRSAS